MGLTTQHPGLHAPLVLVPGLMCDAAVWQPVIDHLSPHITSHVVSHGEANAIEQMAQQVLDGAPPHFYLAGHSMGARVAMEVLRLAPRRVIKAALLDTGYLPLASGAAGELEVSKRMALLAMAQNQGVRAMATEWVQEMVHPSRLADAPLIDAILAMFERKDALLFERQLLALIHRPDPRSTLQQLQLPTLVLCGRQDAWATLAQHQAMHALIPQGYGFFKTVEDAGHMAPMEQAVGVSNALLDWLMG